MKILFFYTLYSLGQVKIIYQNACKKPGYMLQLKMDGRICFPTH